MPPDFRVPIPQPDEELRLYFADGVENDQFGLALDLSVAEWDEGARITRILVTAVEVTGDGVAVHYTVSWEAFHGRGDKTIAGEANRVLRGKTEGADWLFTKAAPPSERSTSDEF